MKKRRFLLLYALGAAVIVITGLILFLLLPDRASETVLFDKSSPGIARTGYIHSDMAAMDRLAVNSRQLLFTDRGYRSWYRIPGRLTAQTAESSLVFLTRDQLTAARIHLEKNDRETLLADLARIRLHYRSSQGLLVDHLTVDIDGKSTLSDGFSNGATLSWLRLLADSYSLTGSEELISELKVSSAAFLSLVGDDAFLPTDSRIAILQETPRADPAATPTIRPSVSPTPVVTGEKAVIRLGDIDLYALKLLIPLDARWQLLYDRQKKILINAVQSSQVPFFAYAYDPAASDYIGFVGSQPLFAMEETLLTLLHIYEASETQSDTLTFIRSHFYESGALYEQYSRADGTPATATECITGYAYLARIARIVGDQTLYEKAIARLTWHLATNTRSVAYGTVFRTDEDERIRVTAQDNLDAQLALR